MVARSYPIKRRHFLGVRSQLESLKSKTLPGVRKILARKPLMPIFKLMSTLSVMSKIFGAIMFLIEKPL